jgi:predicted amidohydrolase
MRHTAILVLMLSWAAQSARSPAAEQVSPHGWSSGAPREELRPTFRFEPTGGPTKGPVWIIAADERPDQDGYWQTSFPVIGGHYYRFGALRQTENAAHPQRSAVATVTWQNDRGELVPGEAGPARPEYPREGRVSNGWTELADTYQAPPQATRAMVKLHFRWAPGGVVRWSAIALDEVPPPAPRVVRLAAVHFRPRGGKTPAENRQMFAPLVAKAAAQRANLVCLGEAVTLCGTGLNYAEAAEAVPGPSTEYFGRLAKEHHLYLVAGVLEREGSTVYNTAVLVGPDGQLAGKYRKVCLPREEIDGGVTPGSDYPVFDTRFGKLGIMICWDLEFPEVARNLALEGAEVIALPIWGGHPLLAQARAIENQVYLVSSTYDSPMKTGVVDRTGQWLAEAREQGDVVVVEIDLNRRTIWEWLGDLKSRIPRERPAGGFED